MSTQLFLVPVIFDAQGRLVPEYLDTDLAGQSFVCMPMGIDGIVLLACDPNTALAAESDVFAFPDDLDTTLADADVANVQAFFSQWNIPSAFVFTGMTFRFVAQVVAKCFQVAQRYHGQTGSAVFSGQTDDSLAQQSAAVAAGDQVPGAPSIPANITLGHLTPAAPTLDAAVSSFPALQANISDVATSFGFTAPDPSASLEDSLVALSQQWTGPLIMSRNGDGFQL